MTARWMMIYLARRNPALAPGQFAQAWREHSALGAGCTNVRDKVLSVMQCSRLLDGTPLPGTSTDYDGVNLLAIRDRGVADDLWTDPETLAIMRPDEPRVFSTYVREFTLLCEARPLRDTPLPEAKKGRCLLAGFVKRGAAVDDVRWAEARDAAPALAGSGRCVWNRVAAEPPPGYDYDAIVEWWFDSADAAREALGAAGVPAMLPQALRSAIDLPASVFMATQVTHHRP